MFDTTNTGTAGALAAVLLAHPGHELRLHGWISRFRPLAILLTTGSRSGEDRSRRQASEHMLDNLECARADAFGAVLDRDFYDLVLSGDARPFRRWIDAVAAALTAHRIDRVIVDGWQLYSVSHDLAHIIGRLAAQQATQISGRPIEVLQYEVVPAALGVGDLGPAVARFLLSEDELQAKRAAVEAYPGIEAELEELGRIERADALRVEALFSVAPMTELLRQPARKPNYELYGETRQSQGTYSEVIRWHHVEAIIRQIIAP